MPASRKLAQASKLVKKPAAKPAKSSPAVLARGEKRPQVYTCKTCGKVTKASSHLCTPTKTDTVFMCTYCGATAGDPFHVCSPMLANIKYFCKNCGRVSPLRGALCKPSTVQ